ncbi:chemotaxis protein histidine kinase-like protein [Xenococcus sp. PCC 7305]|uniref:hybrid sensor histidine kinase/response regulator n=1 Tax=Xenococcus sp. PCC 7305 TaxID=102125 RepID=UPI0002ACCC52|nr:hybrid sensor histidine kinase/response regulator [Xenococcus sp. PCC 7305]ELS05050.1 chemotaxis protein histidine kinase-like protein [Xenococcus sp. PCC 7305]
MNKQNNSHNGKPGEIEKKTIIQNFDVISSQSPEEVNDLFEGHSLEEENSLSLNDLNSAANSFDDADDLLPFIENNNIYSEDIGDLEIESEIDLSASLEGVLDSESNNIDDLDDLEELNDLVSSSVDLEALDSSNELTELDELLDEPINDMDSLDEFGELDNLLDPNDDDLDGLLVDSKAEKPPSQPLKNKVSKAKINPPLQPEAPKGQVFEQTMRVSVKKLDNLNNMIGELVVKRNRLEEDQERLRRFLDNLLNHVQSLGEMGGKMHDLYERSLLEGALIASRQQNQANSRKVSSFIDVGAKDEGDDELNALELDRFTGFHLLSQDIIELIVRVREAASDIQFVVDETDKVAQSLRQVTGQLQDGMNSSRMVAFGQTTDRLPRAIRDISRKLHKQVNLNVEGKDVLIDKMIVENLYNPMTHLVNNAITHGIESPEERIKLGKSEQGTIHIRAFLQGNQTVITITDDGAGIDPERVKAKAVEKNLITWAQAQNLSKQDVYDLLFRAGFSTKDQADDFSGRGVGMDVVSTDLKKIRGTISIESEIGKGTVFTIRLPLVLSICKALTCVFNGTRIAFPIDGVEDTSEYHLSDIQTNANGIKSISWNNSLLPFQPLGNLLSYNRRIARAGIYNVNQEEDTVSIIILRSTDNLLALEVDQVLGEQEIVIKQIEAPIPKPAGIAGATVLGDGTIMPIGDVLELIEIAQGKRTINLGFSIWQDGKANKEDDIANEPMVLVVDDSITVRELLTLSFNKLGYRVEQARDGQEAWDKLRGGLPCDMIFCDIEMPRMNGLELLSNLQKDEELKLIPVAMLTSRGAEKHRNMATDLGAKAYLTKPYTEKDLMDVAQKLIEISLANKETELMVVNDNTEFNIYPNDPKSSINNNPVVLIIDDSVTVRELLSMTFLKAGYQVEKAKDGQEAWDKLQDGLECDLAFCDIEMPRMNGLELLSHLQKDENLASFPIAMLTSRGAQKMRNIAAKRGAKGYFVKPYVEENLLDAAERMMNGEMLLELDLVDD